MTAGGAEVTLVTIDDVEAAAALVRTTCVRTPVLELADRRLPTPVWIKAESLQRTGSFKLRGATHAVAALDAEARRAGVVTYSAGNHGRALAYAARRVGASATVVMPDTAPPAKVGATRALGARVVIQRPDDIMSHAGILAEEEGRTLVPPFDDPHIIAGQGTVGLEVLDQVGEIETVVVPVGGGGLLAGVAAALKARRPEIRVVGAEPELAGDLAEGFAAGEHSTWSRARTTRTVADGLRAAAVGQLTWEHITALVDDVVTVSEEAIVSAMRSLAASTKIVVEASGAVAPAAVLQHGQGRGFGLTVAIASGGNVDVDAFASLVRG